MGLSSFEWHKSSCKLCVTKSEDTQLGVHDSWQALLPSDSLHVGRQKQDEPSQGPQTRVWVAGDINLKLQGPLVERSYKEDRGQQNQ